MIGIINDDILSNLNMNQKTVVLQGCNCFHIMGAGLAKYLRDRYPSVYTADVTQTKKGDKDKLGTFSTAVITENFNILNCYTQYYYGRERKLYANYKAIELCFKEVVKRYDTAWEIRMPRIGCGLAGGDWDIVEPIVQTIFEKHNVKIYYK
jgi:O-acetyl-ADP-ribose deacetylase (regulator of RNase III)